MLINFEGRSCSMLPRKSAVVRYLIVGIVLVTAIFWLTNDNSGDASSSWNWKAESDALLNVNETELRKELNRIQQEAGDVSSSPIPENLTLAELRDRVVQMRHSRPRNPHPFKYVINPQDVCSGDVFLLVYVHSAPSHFKQRMAIRETWGNSNNFPGVAVKVVFLCGIIPSKEGSAVQDALSLEADTYGDIVQENFIDSYRNLTYKGIMGLKWITQYCRNARFLLKSDDDIFINMFSLVTHLKRIESQRGRPVRKLLLCLVWYHMKVMRDTHSKWYLSPTEYPDDYFPTYCSGSAFILSTDVAAAMFDASFKVPFFWVDDFYVTGLLAREVGVTHENFNSVYMLSPSAFLQKFTEPNTWLTLVIGHCHKINQLKIVWNNVLAEQKKRQRTSSDESQSGRS
jgi:hypothetical protein